jgi:hypothetical protein
VNPTEKGLLKFVDIGTPIGVIKPFIMIKKYYLNMLK